MKKRKSALPNQVAPMGTARAPKRSHIELSQLNLYLYPEEEQGMNSCLTMKLCNLICNINSLIQLTLVFACYEVSLFCFLLCWQNDRKTSAAKGKLNIFCVCAKLWKASK